jgi:hypothetical protein
LSLPVHRSSGNRSAPPVTADGQPPHPASCWTEALLCNRFGTVRRSPFVVRRSAEGRAVAARGGAQGGIRPGRTTTLRSSGKPGRRGACERSPSGGAGAGRRGGRRRPPRPVGPSGHGRGRCPLLARLLHRRAVPRRALPATRAGGPDRGIHAWSCRPSGGRPGLAGPVRSYGHEVQRSAARAGHGARPRQAGESGRSRRPVDSAPDTPHTRRKAVRVLCFPGPVRT